MTALAYARELPNQLTFRAQSSAVSYFGSKISELLTTATIHARNNATDWRSFTKALIEEIARECQLPNWDGYGAHPISQRAKSHAQIFIDMLPYSFPHPEPMPDPDGEIALCWDFGPEHIFTLSINSTGVLSYAGLLGKGVKRHGMEQIKDKIPKSIIESIKELCEQSDVAY